MALVGASGRFAPDLNVRARDFTQQPTTSYRRFALANDSFLTAVSAPQADKVEKMKMELLRVGIDEHVRTEKRCSAGACR